MSVQRIICPALPYFPNQIFRKITKLSKSDPSTLGHCPFSAGVCVLVFLGRQVPLGPQLTISYSAAIMPPRLILSFCWVSPSFSGASCCAVGWVGAGAGLEKGAPWLGGGGTDSSPGERQPPAGLLRVR